VILLFVNNDNIVRYMLEKYFVNHEYITAVTVYCCNCTLYIMSL
jgi:hypothetical protein